MQGKKMKNLLTYMIICVGFLIAATCLQAEVLTATKQAREVSSQRSLILTKALLGEVNTHFKKKERPDKKKKKVKPDKKPDKKKKKEKKPDKKEKAVIDWEKQFDKSMAKFNDKLKTEDEAFNNAYKISNARWEKERKAFIKRLDDYIENLVEPRILAPAKTNNSISSLEAPVVSSASLNSSGFHMIPGAFDVPVRDQGRRGTCAAFTAIRAFETIASIYEKRVDLSEQYFYWSSKPGCQQQACNKVGSWYGNGLVASLRAATWDVPLESRCPYIKNKVANNETQVPLQNSCNSGVAKALDFKQIKNEQILGEIINNHPVLAAFRLSPNFYRSRGVISHNDAFKAGKKDAHAGGHAILLVGYIKLPASYHDAEGAVCYVTANSWSEGWGKGGYGCLTQKWVDTFSIAHMSLKTIDISPSVF